jgi:hypothetical protein
MSCGAITACRWLRVAFVAGIRGGAYLELDFADRLATFKDGERLFLVLAGWTDYPYPESIYAATQAGVALKPLLSSGCRRTGRGKRSAILASPRGCRG